MMPDLPGPIIPGSTYRLQFNQSFTFRDASRVIAYLHDLGITDIYASPYFKAKQGSPHGYDIVDHNQLNPEIGTESDHAAMIDELRRHGMGQVLDIVPNHMCIESPGNRWWSDVLENGRASTYARYFDVDWFPVKKELLNRILIPVLGDQYGKVLEDQQLSVAFAEGTFFVRYLEYKFPLQPTTYDFVLKQHLQELQDRLTQDDPHVAELLSIMTASKHLPSSLETGSATIEERNREKEVIKRRLDALYQGSSEIRLHIDGNLRAFNGTKGDPKSFDLLDELMNQQIYRLSHWRVATDEINYRRFFDVNGLAAIRMEDPAVFAAAHALIFRMVGSGSVTGLRVDHADGLYNPVEYLHWLQRGCLIHQVLARRSRGANEPLPADHLIEAERELGDGYNKAVLEDPGYKPFYIVVEKILTKSERMPADWPVSGSTGYVFLNSVNGIFVDGENAKAFDGIYDKFIHQKTEFTELMYEKKKLVMQLAMASELNTLARYLDELSEKNRHTRDFTLNSLKSAIVEVIASFPVYRTYINTWHVSDRDAQYIEQAASRAKRRNPAVNGSIFDFLEDVLLLRFPEDSSDKDKAEWLDFVMRFQQQTGPVMAKGVEDTALSVYNRLVSLNEVGGMPERFGMTPETFHGLNIERIKNWPHSLITTSTHDTKRSEDVRARINVLSEIPHEWGDRSRRWAELNRKKKSVIDGENMPDRNDEYLLYQTLVGVWPNEMPGQEAYDRFVQRIREYMLKEAREAKVNTSWINPNKAYEDALLAFIDAVLTSPGGNPFLNELLPFQQMVSWYGMFNSLAQTLLKITSPGVPDFYQGTDLWDYSLVDPDNRGPVDYGKRMGMLAGLKDLERRTGARILCRDLSTHMDDGRIKLYLTWKALNFRKSERKLFSEGEYVPLEADGPRSGNICAFERWSGQAAAITVVPRFLTRITSGLGALPFGASVWEGSALILPREAGTEYRNVFTGLVLSSALQGRGRTGLSLSDVFSDFPVALLERVERAPSFA